MSKDEFKKSVMDHLRRSAVMAVATVGEGARPEVAYVLFVADSDFNFYFATRSDTAKAKAITKNNRVSLTAGIARPFNVQASGIAEEVTDAKEMNKIFAELAEIGGRMDNFWPPVLHLGNADYVVYKVVTDWMRVLDLRSAKINEPSSVFNQIKG